MTAATVDSRYSWLRLAATLAIAAIGGVGMWSVVVVLPEIQAEFGADRAAASLPYSSLMVGFALGGIVIGRAVDRFGIAMPLAGAALAQGLGYAAAAHAGSLWQFAFAHGLLIGVGSAAFFGPLMADISHWFARRRGIAVSVVASGNYIAGVFWPPVVQHLGETVGWRATHSVIAFLTVAAVLPLSVLLRRRAPHVAEVDVVAAADRTRLGLGVAPVSLQILLSVAGLACCFAMAMPQVHIVAYCGDLGYGAARGAEMLSLMLGFGIVSRVGSGIIADRVGGLGTLLLGSSLQAVALMLYLSFDGLASLYVISALFGLFQGGIVPSYAIIIREFFPPREAATRLGIVLVATLLGMALGGWLSGTIYDHAGSYRLAFAAGLAWNFLNLAIASWLILRRRRVVALAAA